MAAFAAIYLIWGSTYLGIRIAIETLPPFFMAGVRFLVAGGLLYIWARLRGAPRPTRSNWGATLIIGGLLLLGGNGGVTWSEQTVPSGLVALLVALVPLWVVVIDWLRPGGVRPSAPIIGGLVLGLAGMVLLIGPGDIGGGSSVGLVDTLVLMGASLSWSIGSVYSRYAALPESPLMTTAMEMLCGGALLSALGGLTGEWSRLDLGVVSLRSIFALAYLIVFGAIVAFSAYTWLLRVVPPARAATYAYVNPVVAVVLGALAGEPLTARTLIAAVIIIIAVVLITTYRLQGAVPPVRPSPVQEVEQQIAGLGD